MKIFNIYWNHYQKQYFYSEDINTYTVEPCDKIKKNEPIKKFNRWLDKFILLQNEEIENDILLIIKKNFDNIENIHPNNIKNVLKLYKLNKYYKMIPSIYCHIIGFKFHINEELKLNIKKNFNIFINSIYVNTYINYYFFIKSVLLYYNEYILSSSIPCINSLDKNYEYIIMWNHIKNNLTI
jgi:hypothetical protein